MIQIPKIPKKYINIPQPPLSETQTYALFRKLLFNETSTFPWA
jgi:hypothetical protein